MISMKRFILSALLAASFIHSASAAEATLSFSDGKESIQDLSKINEILHTVGVHVSQTGIPMDAQSILTLSMTRALDDNERARILSLFELKKEDLLNQIKKAEREPAVKGGGSLSTGEDGALPYPKIYDLIAMSPQNKIHVQKKFGKLHVNFAEDSKGGVEGVDEVMTLVSGGPWTWFFLLKDDVVAKLTMSPVPSVGPAWRLSYPGLTPHGAFLDAKDGICVAYIHGPKIWEMRYEAANIEGAKWLGKNPWVDFAKGQPELLDTAKKLS